MSATIRIDPDVYKRLQRHHPSNTYIPGVGRDARSRARSWAITAATARSIRARV
jgi:hypothetical protein